MKQGPNLDFAETSPRPSASSDGLFAGVRTTGREFDPWDPTPFLTGAGPKIILVVILDLDLGYSKVEAIKKNLDFAVCS